MAKLLYIEASPRKQRSASIEVARAFLDAYAAAHPGDRIEKMDLWQSDLPEFNNEVLDAKYAILHGQPHTESQAAAWRAVVALADRFKSADKYLFSLPMWNFGIPYKLKHFIDVLTQPGLTFSFTPQEGYKGLVTGRPVAAIYARGGEYPAGTPGDAYDLQKRYLELWLGFIGFGGIRAICVEPMLGAPDAASAAREKAKALAQEMGAGF